jgi:FtsH-binding integral membrane protein
MEAYYPDGRVVANALPDERAAFIRKTYGHLAGAILAFTLIEAALFQTSLPESMVGLLATSRYSWLIVLGGFMGISWLANNWAQSGASLEMQYAGLALYVVAEAIIFVPLLYMAAVTAGGEVIPTAGILTLLLFTGLTYTAFTTKKDFSFLGGMLKISCFIALGIIVASIVFGFSLGLIFSAFMVLVAAGAILYDTSNIMYRYNTTQYVAASLSLFASVALMFWYILRIVMGGGSRRS